MNKPLNQIVTKVVAIDTRMGVMIDRPRKERKSEADICQ